MTHSSGLFTGDEFHSEFLSADGQLSEDPLAVSFLEVVLALVGDPAPIFLDTNLGLNRV